MNPTFWMTIRIGGRRIPFLLPLVLPLTLVMEILAILPLTIYAIRKKEYLPLKVVSRLYLSRFMFALMVHGGGFKINVCDGGDRFGIVGRIRY